MHAVLEEHEPGQFVVKLHGELDMATEPVLTDMVQASWRSTCPGCSSWTRPGSGRCCRFVGPPKTVG